MTEAHLLSSPPVSGSIDEVRFDAVGNCLWVKFADDEYQEWCGVFGPGFDTFSKAVVTDQSGHCFIISSGQGYIVDVHTRGLLHKTENDALVFVIVIPGRELFIACSSIRLIAYSPAGVIWQSRRVSVDGIKFLEVNESTLTGQVWNMEDWVDFVLDIDGWKYHSEYMCDF